MTGRAVRFCLVAFLIARLTVSLLGLTVGLLSVGRLPDDPRTVRQQITPGLHNVVDGTERLDAAWFIALARDGYHTEPYAAAFYPGYPLVIRAVDTVPGVSTLSAALFVSNAALLGALIVLYRLTTTEIDEPAAKRTVVVLLAFPTSFFLLAPYSESLFLLLTLLAMASIRGGRWARGTLAGAAAAMTRSVGVALIPAFAVEAWQQAEDRPAKVKGLMWSAAVALGPLLYFAWWGLRGGDWLAPVEAQRHWQRVPMIPLQALAQGIYQAAHAIGASNGGYWVSDAVLTCVAIAGLVAVARRVPLTYIVYGFCSVLMPLSYPYPGRDLVSMSRFVLVVFPAFWGIARWTRRRPAFIAWLVVSIPLAVWHTVLFMHGRHIY